MTTSQLITRNWRDLIRPKTVPIDQDSISTDYGKFTCEPLERGYGQTLGNSLRRVLLSSLQGAAARCLGSAAAAGGSSSSSFFFGMHEV